MTNSPSQPLHDVSIVIGGKRISGWTSYEIGSSMIEPVDHFTVERPFDAEIWRACVPDSAVKIKIDDTVILVGFVDDRTKSSGRDGSMMTINGRDKVGRLIQESAPYIAYDGLDLLTLAKRVADPWFTDVVLSDARNRYVRLGKGHKAVGGSEPLILKARKKIHQVTPGTFRWKVIEELVSEAGYLMWSSADGRELIIGKPNYSQDVQFLCVQALPGSTRSTTVETLTIRESVADRYSLIAAVGAAAGDSASYGKDTVSRRNYVRNGPGIDGTGVDFQYPKRLILTEHNLQSEEEAIAAARLEMDRRDMHRLVVTARMRSHGQISAGTTPTIFAPNTLARVVDEETDLEFNEICLIHSCRYSSGRQAGETTELTLVPKGTTLVP